MSRIPLFCKDCLHFAPPTHVSNTVGTCRRPLRAPETRSILDLVTGEMRSYTWSNLNTRRADHEREGARFRRCGRCGRFWRSKT